jgi:hypothetical protein
MLKIQKVLALIVTSLLLVAMLAGCAGPPDAAAPAGDEPNLVVAADQTAPESGLVTLERVKLANNGYVAIRSDASGSPSDTVVGYNRYSAGDNTNVSFTLQDFASLPAGANTLWAVLHQDAGTDAVFEFPGSDTALANSDGTTVMDSFVLTK